MRFAKMKICRLHLGRVVNGNVVAAWQEDVLKHMTPEQAAKYVRRTHSFDVVMLGCENIIEQLDIEKAYFEQSKKVEESKNE